MRTSAASHGTSTATPSRDDTATRPPDDARSARIELAILIGLPASGKSTFYRTRLAGTHAHISRDLLGNKGDARRRQRELIEAAFAGGRSVAVDNVNARVTDRAPLIELGRARGARLVGYHVGASAEECVARNRGRTGKEKVPDVAIYVARSRLVAPSYDEGFDELYEVTVAEAGGFDVTPIARP